RRTGPHAPALRHPRLDVAAVRDVVAHRPRLGPHPGRGDAGALRRDESAPDRSVRRSRPRAQPRRRPAGARPGAVRPDPRRREGRAAALRPAVDVLGRVAAAGLTARGGGAVDGAAGATRVPPGVLAGTAPLPWTGDPAAEMVAAVSAYLDRALEAADRRAAAAAGVPPSGDRADRAAVLEARRDRLARVIGVVDPRL